jgi:hypothetical protein
MMAGMSGHVKRTLGDLAVLVPSRGRPDAVAALARSIEVTATAATALIVVVDLDDPAATAYPVTAAGSPNLPGLLALERTTGAADALNLVACRYAPGVRNVMFLPDAWRPVSPGWDKAVVDALDAGAGLAYGREITAERVLPRHIAARSQVVETLGYLAPAGVPCGAWPDVWAGWGRQCGITAVSGAGFTRDARVPRRGPSLDERVVAEVAAWAQYRRSGQAERDEQALAALAAGWRQPVSG